MTPRAGAVAVLALLLAPLLAGAPAPRAEAAGGVRLSVTTLSPAVATSGSTLDVSGTVTNGGSEVVRHTVVRLLLSDTRLNSRAELAAVMAGKVTSRDGAVMVEVPLADLAPGATSPFDLHEPLDQAASLTGFGVYALGIEVVGTRGGGSADPSRLTITRTLVPWVPGTPDFTATGFSWVWPLVSAPVRLANGDFADDSLASELAPGGRLDRLVQAGSQLEQGAGLTWAIDPDLVETVADMAGGYRVATSDNGTVSGGGTALAQRWLDALRAATAGRTVITLPYADPDLAGLVHHGVPGDLSRARSTGSLVLARLLPGAVTADEIAWPVDGYADRDTLAALARTGVTAVVLTGRALPPTIDLSYTPSGRGQVSTGVGRVAALLADPGLADLLARAGRHGANPVLTGQRVVAETAMITSELPSTGTARTIVAMPPRRWDPPPEFLDQIVTLAQAPWAASVGLRTLAGTPPPEVDRGRLRYPAAERRGELPVGYLRGLDGQRDSIANFAAILTDRTQLVPGLASSLRRLESSWWRGREARSNRLNVEKFYLADTREKVRVQGGSFTFGSKSGKIPVTLVNELSQAVVVVLRLEPQTPRLRLDPVELEPIGPKQKVQVGVDATAVAGGPVVVDATLRTPSGALYGQPVALRVNVTQIGAVALIITVAAAVVLFLTAGIRVVRRVRSSPGDGPGLQADADEDTDVTV